MARSYVKVNELITWASSGDLQLPEIQRRYVWPATRVRDLLDSLYRGYPSGSILLWETAKDIETKSLSVEQGPESRTTFAIKKILLDGQQRITSLTSVIKGKQVVVRNRKKPIDIMFNLEHPDDSDVEVVEVEEDPDLAGPEEAEESEENDVSDVLEELNKLTFVVANSSLKNNPRWVPVSDIFVRTDKEILKPLGISSEDDEWDKYSERLRNIRKIRDYEYVVEILPQDLSYHEVAQIFVRVNSKGMKLRGHDLALAQISANWKGYLEVIENFAKEFRGDEDYLVETGAIVRTMVAFATQQCRFDRIGNTPVEQLKAVLEDTKKGLRYSINFLKNNANVGALENLSSPLLIIPIAVYSFLKKEKLSSVDEKTLLKWFYLAHMRRHYSMGSTESYLDADLALLFKKKELAGLIENLRNHVKKFDVDESDILNKGRTSAIFSMLYFIMRTEKAKDWETGLLLSDNQAGRQHLMQFDHIFPRSILREREFEPREINEIANLAFVSGRTNIRKSKKLPLDYFKTEIVPNRGTSDLVSQLIPQDENLWRLENYRLFKSYRRKAMAEKINKFIGGFDLQGPKMEEKPSQDTNGTPYEIMKSLEKKLRNLIETSLSQVSKNWWLERIPNDVREKAELKKKRNENPWPWQEKDHPILSYLDFNDYVKIIRRTDNWKQVFSRVFVRDELLASKLAELDPIRNSIAHSRDLDQQDMDRLRLLAGDILRSIDKAISKN